MAERDGQLEEISKQEALRETGISYGQFYRWKRMGLIPEAWFHRRATFTGQESFLPRQRLLERIARIQQLKDQYSLEEIAEMLSPEVTARQYAPEEIARAGLDVSAVQAVRPPGSDAAGLQFVDLVCGAVAERLRQAGGLSDREVRLALATVRAWFTALAQAGGERQLVIARREGAATAVCCVGECRFDPEARVVASLNLEQIAEELKVRLDKYGV